MTRLARQARTLDREKPALRTVEPIRWTDQGVVLLDQRRLPGEVIYHTYTDYRELARAIQDMVIRGAPAIGVAAATAGACFEGSLGRVLVAHPCTIAITAVRIVNASARLIDR